MICECLDGPYRGLMVRVGVRAEFVEVRDHFDASRQAHWYQVVTVDFGAKELRWARTSYAP